MNRVVCAIEPSIHSAYQSSAYQSSEDIDVSSTAVYDKLAALEPGVSAELVRQGGEQLTPIAHESHMRLKASRKAGIPCG